MDSRGDPHGSRPKVSIIIPARNESRTIAKVIGEARQVRLGSEIIVVCNGSQDPTAEIAKKAGASKVIVSPASLGHDVGRSVGARHAGGDILLFIDADFVIPSSQLRPYVGTVEEGWDLVLNPYPGISLKHPVTIAKHLLNHMLGRSDLSGSSMTVVPHALSRRALETIGAEKLCVPPLAHAAAILGGLSVTSSSYINTTILNRKRANRKENVTELILGDHAEAAALLISCRGPRAGLTDYKRRRDVLSLPDTRSAERK